MEKEEQGTNQMDREELVGKLPYGLRVFILYRKVTREVGDKGRGNLEYGNYIKIMKYNETLLIDTEDIENLCILLLKASRKLSQ